MEKLNKYEKAIVRNANWFITNQREEGFIDMEGDEFYGIRGDATLIGHSVTVRMYAYALTGDSKYLNAAEKSLDWLKERQDAEGGWRDYAGYTLDAAQCVFEGFNTYQSISGNSKYNDTLRRAASRMVNGTIGMSGELLLANIIEIGEYAHFSLLAWKTTGETKFKEAAETILDYIQNNYDETEGFWNPYDKNQKTPFLAPIVRPVLRGSMRIFPPKGRLLARISDSLIPYVTSQTHPQYSMSLMDSEALLDTLDGSCSFPVLAKQTDKAIEWVKTHCPGPFPGTLVESRPEPPARRVYPIAIINDTKMAAAWPTSLLLLAYCGLRDGRYAEAAACTADWLVTIQDENGGFFNFQKPDGSFLDLQSGNVNFYISMALWIFNEVYGESKVKLFTKPI